MCSAGRKRVCIVGVEGVGDDSGIRGQALCEGGNPPEEEHIELEVKDTVTSDVVVSGVVEVNVSKGVLGVQVVKRRRQVRSW